MSNWSCSNSWDVRLGEPRRDLTRDEVAELSASRPGRLRGYYEAVTAETDRFVQDEFDFDTMYEPIDVSRRLALAPVALAFVPGMPGPEHAVALREYPAARPSRSAAIAPPIALCR
jgi:hypothetical protein